MTPRLASLLFALAACGKAPASTDKPAPEGPARTPGKGRYPIDVAGKAGYIDDHGNVAIPATYRAGRRFSEGLAMVQVGEHWGYIDEAGTLVVPATWDQATDPTLMPDPTEGDAFHSGAAFVMDPATHKLVVIDRTGKVTWHVEGLPGGVFGEGLVPMLTTGVVFVDPTGKVVLDGGWSTGFRFTDGRALVVKNGMTNFIDKTGKTISDTGWFKANNFSSGLARVQIGEGVDTYQYIDPSGAVAIPGPFRAMSQVFEGGMARVVTGDEKYAGWIDVHGTHVANIPAGSVVGDHFSEGRMVASYDGTLKYYDTTGAIIDTKIATPKTVHVKAYPFHDGLAMVSVAGATSATYYVNLAGQVVYP